jgi:transcriptional regulator with XRE-family HTH domain
MSLHLKIKHEAERKGITLSALADQIGMSRQNLHYRTRTEAMSYKQLKAVAKALRMDLWELVR